LILEAPVLRYISSAHVDITGGYVCTALHFLQELLSLGIVLLFDLIVVLKVFSFRQISNPLEAVNVQLVLLFRAACIMTVWVC
jgi:hypothetical protein